MIPLLGNVCDALEIQVQYSGYSLPQLLWYDVIVIVMDRIMWNQIYGVYGIKYMVCVYLLGNN